MAGESEDKLEDEVGEVDPWRFTGSFIRNALSGSIPERATHAKIPWTPLSKPVARAKVALVSTAGLSMRGDSPFDMEYERQNPTRGDSSFRRITADATSATIDANHLHPRRREIFGKSKSESSQADDCYFSHGMLP